MILFEKDVAKNSIVGYILTETYATLENHATMVSVVRLKEVVLLAVLSLCSLCPTAVDADCDGEGAAGKQIVVSGACERLSSLNRAFTLLGKTVDGKEYFASGNGDYLYYDSDCGGDELRYSARWMFAPSKPSTSATKDLAGDGGACSSSGYLSLGSLGFRDLSSTSANHPPANAEWQMWCDIWITDVQITWWTDVQITISAPTCICKLGYSGDNCETNIDDCIGKKCSDHGTCIDGVNEYTCDCDANYAGTECQTILLHGLCDPQNDMCDQTKGLVCMDQTYTCRYSTTTSALTSNPTLTTSTSVTTTTSFTSTTTTITTTTTTTTATTLTTSTTATTTTTTTATATTTTTTATTTAAPTAAGTSRVASTTPVTSTDNDAKSLGGAAIAGITTPAATPGDACESSRGCTGMQCKNKRCCRSDINLACTSCDDAGFCDTYNADLFSNTGTSLNAGAVASTDGDGVGLGGTLPPPLATDEPELLEAEEEGGLEGHDIVGTVFGVAAVLIAAGVLAWKLRKSDDKWKELLVFFGCEDAEEDFDQNFNDNVRTCAYVHKDSNGLPTPSMKRCNAKTTSKYCPHHECESPNCPNPAASNTKRCDDCKNNPTYASVTPPPPPRPIRFNVWLKDRRVAAPQRRMSASSSV